MEKIRYFYECDYCKLKKDITLNRGDRTFIEGSLLREGWLFVGRMDMCTCGLGEDSNCVGGSFMDSGHFCSISCLLKKIEERYKDRMSY